MSGGLTYYYSTVAPRPRFGGFSTSRQELLQIGLAYVVLTVCLTIILSQHTILFGGAQAESLSTISPLLVGISAIAALSGFVAHELAHKFVAQRRGFWAEFRMWPVGLVLALVSSVVGILWGAPGATMVGGMSDDDRADWGRTSVAGPLTNVAFAGVFYGAAMLLFRAGSDLFGWMLLLAWINGWFGTFNLLPLGPLDGRKVLRWSVGVWIAAIALTGAMAVLSYIAYAYQTPFLNF